MRPGAGGGNFYLGQGCLDLHTKPSHPSILSAITVLHRSLIQVSPVERRCALTNPYLQPLQSFESGSIWPSFPRAYGASVMAPGCRPFRLYKCPGLRQPQNLCQTVLCDYR